MADEDTGPFPLSFAQQRLWFLDQFDPGSIAYNSAKAWHIHGDLDWEALREALNALVARHEALRTNFLSVDGRPLQMVCAHRSIPLPVTDLAGTSPAEREPEARRLAREEGRRPFDLTRDAMLRAMLIRLGEADHVLVLTMHHIASDAWSEWVLRRELAALYAAFGKGLPSPLPELPIQYGDYAVWQRNWLTGRVLDAQLAYWKKQLGGELPLLSLPTDYPRPASRSYRGAKSSDFLPVPLTAGLKALSRREGATLFMTLLACFQIFLYRYTGQEDIVVGSPVANRNRVEVEGLIGFFVNTLVLRADLSGAPTFRELLQRTRALALDSYSHAEMPFEKLVEELQPERELSHAPLFQVVLTMQNAPSAELRLEGLDLTPWDLDLGTSKFDLTLQLGEDAGGLLATFEYDTDLFSADTIRRMFGHFRVLLEGVVSDPDARISELPLLTEEERRQLLVEWNEAPASVHRDRCVHESFEAEASKHPDSIAVAFEGRRMSYGELNRRANQLAHYLRARGVGPETLTGVYVERSFDLVVAILGILKAGGAYLPLDPDHPPQRIALILEDAMAPVLLTHKGLAARLPRRDGLVVLLDEDWGSISSYPEGDPQDTSHSDDLAYVIYTSGSTGRPKGVMVTHGNLARLFSATQGDFGFDERDAWALFHSCAFDFSVWEMWGALVHGGRLVVVPRLTAQSPDVFLQLLSEEDVTVLSQIPSAFEQLLTVERELTHRLPLRLRLIVLGGETLDVQILEPWLDRYGDRSPRLVNMYGITETTVHVTRYQVRQDDLASSQGSIIGRPIPCTQVYLLDPHMNPVPAGVPGEIYVGGDRVARGYWNNPVLTAERFLPDPFRERPSARLYRTGDLARFRPDGNIEFLGRLDDQVKIRGYRVEPGEIEAVLREHPRLREVAVVVHKGESRDKRLAAYVVAAQGAALVNSDLRQYLLKRVPEYMVPSVFIQLEQLPRLPNGKIDRRSLPPPGQTRQESGNGFIGPRNPIEEELCRIWQEALGLERVSVRDNFFDLGGHSLLAVVLMNRVERTFGWRVPISELFRAPTVEEQAELLGHRVGG